jgi:hypothetical protein
LIAERSSSLIFEPIIDDQNARFDEFNIRTALVFGNNMRFFTSLDLHRASTNDVCWQKGESIF